MGENNYYLDQWGNLKEGSDFVGFRDIDNKCYLFNGDVVNCPPLPDNFKDVSKTDSRTYYWVIVLVGIVFVIGLAFFVNRKK